MRVPLLDDDVDLRRKDVLVQVEMPVVTDVHVGATVGSFSFRQGTQDERTEHSSRSRKSLCDTVFSGYCCSEKRGNDLVG